MIMRNVNNFVDYNLVERLKRVDNLTKIVFDAIGLPSKKFQMWVVRDLRSLTILTSDNFLATRIRFEQQQIIHYINNHSAFVIDTIKVKMTMPKMTKRQPTKTTYNLSERTSKIISAIADSIEDDGLREGLLNIAKQQR